MAITKPAQTAKTPGKKPITGAETTQVGVIVYGGGLDKDVAIAEAKKTHVVVDKGSYAELHPIAKDKPAVAA